MTDHCILDYSRQPPRLLCTRCGYEETITLPIRIRQDYLDQALNEVTTEACG